MPTRRWAADVGDLVREVRILAAVLVNQSNRLHAAGALTIPNGGKKIAHGKAGQKPIHRRAGKRRCQEQPDVHAFQLRKRGQHIFINLDLINCPNLQLFGQLLL